MLSKIIGLWVLLMLSSNAHASLASLERFFARVNTLTADFEQSVTDESGMLLEKSSGVLSLSRPGKFRWNYQSLDSSVELGQQIIADGDYIYMYDPDLEQVTQRGLADALDQVPSLVLVQKNGGLVAEHFQMREYGITDGLSWVSLVPLQEDAAYQQLMIAFDDGVISKIVLLDGLGNETSLHLSKVKENNSVAAKTFQFSPPENTDILFQ